MTTSRIVRGNKGRIFAYVIAIVLITGIIACYNNTLSQLEEARLGKEVCQRESENLSTQLQMISDYKQRLEKSLKVEKAEHSQSKKELQTKLDEERVKNEKTASQIKMQLSSLQQNYQLLQIQHEDFKQKCTDNQQEQANEINQLQATLKEAEEELKRVKKDKENLKVFKDEIERKMKNTHIDTAQYESEINRLTKENNELKRKLQGTDKEVTEAKTFETLSAPSESTRKSESSTNFSKQVSFDGDHQLHEDKDKPVVDQPLPNSIDHNNEINEAVLVMPNGADSQNSPSSKLPTKSSSKDILSRAVPLKKSFTVTPENNENVPPFPYPYKNKLPDGVVDTNRKKEKNNLEDIGDSFPNRYRNNIMENERVKEEEAKKSEQAAAKIEEIEKDDGAHEELDFPVPGEEKIKLEHQHVNNMDTLRDEVQERAADVDQNEQLEEEDDDDDINNEQAIRN